MVCVAEAAESMRQYRAEQEARQAAKKRRRGAKNFYLSPAWRKLRYAALRANREKHGRLTCEACGSIEGPWHVDHIQPRSKFPERELDAGNLQCMCEACNLGKSNRDSLDWREPAEVETQFIDSGNLADSDKAAEKAADDRLTDVAHVPLLPARLADQSDVRAVLNAGREALRGSFISKV